MSKLRLDAAAPCAATADAGLLNDCVMAIRGVYPHPPYVPHRTITYEHTVNIYIYGIGLVQQRRHYNSTHDTLQGEHTRVRAAGGFHVSWMDGEGARTKAVSCARRNILHNARPAHAPANTIAVFAFIPFGKIEKLQCTSRVVRFLYFSYSLCRCRSFSLSKFIGCMSCTNMESFSAITLSTW